MVQPRFQTRFARNEDDLLAAQRLRHSVFVEELGAKSSGSDREQDRFDVHADHLLLLDKDRPVDDRVVGIYRLMNREQALAAGGFSCEAEYELTRIVEGRKKLLELGRSCLHADYRGGPAMFYLWRALAEHIESTRTELLFGVASFHGSDPAKFAGSIEFLRQNHLAPKDIRVESRNPVELRGRELTSDDRKAAIAAMPALIKAYLRLGGVIGEGVYVDHAFNTTDVCMLLDMARVSQHHRAIYSRELA